MTRAGDSSVSVMRGTGSGDGAGPSAFSTPTVWRMGTRALPLEPPVIMGVVNLTPDSFSDGGRYRDVEHALDVARAMVDAGAGMVDVGGESTRPGAEEVPAQEEIRRVIPFLERASAAGLGAPLSVDTRKAAVARAALDAGAIVVNDVSGFTHDPEMAPLVAERSAGAVLMHMRGDPSNMRARARYTDVVDEVVVELRSRLDAALGAGIEASRIVVDPGLGFAKDAEQSLALLADLDRLRELGRPLLVGPSRKSFIGALTGAEAGDRLPGTIAACVMAYFQGARIFRVHDVGPVLQALTVAAAVASTPPPTPGR